jgi:hypothetical protein
MHKRPKCPTLTVDDLIQRYGVDRSTVRRWVRAGLATVRRGRQGQRGPTFDGAVVKQWVERYAGQEQDLRRALCHRLDSLSRVAVRMLRQLEHDNMPVDEILRVSNEMVRRTRERLLRVPKDLVDVLSAADVAKLRAEIEEAIDGVCGVASTDAAEPIEPKPQTRSHVVTASNTVREARTQLAELQGEVLDFRERIAAGRAWMAARGGRIYPLREEA